jgi:transcription antitermination factor NusG
LKHWYVLRVTVGTELKVPTAAEAWGCYVPVERLYQRRAAGQSEITRPLFAGYVFVQADLTDPLSSAGVICAKSRGRFIMGHDGYPAQISEAAVMAIAKLVDAGRWDQVKTHSERFAAMIGKRVKIPFGALKGFEVTVLRATGPEFVEVSGSLGNKPFKTEIEVTAEMLESAA